MGLIHAEDYSEAGWRAPERADERARWYCERLEEGEIIFFPGVPFALDEEDRAFLLNVRQTSSGVHKNISYKPGRDRVQGSKRGSAGGDKLLKVMRAYSRAVVNFLEQFLSPYANHWRLDFASYRPLEEQGRALPTKRRNDLLHVDSFPTRPSNGNRILRVFTNLNPQQPRVWLTAEPFDTLVRKYADPARLRRMAAKSRSPLRPLGRKLLRAARSLGLPVIDRPLYDEYMLAFHDELKFNGDFQENCAKSKWEFPPGSTWLVFTDTVPHAVLSGQFALEQTFIVSREALLLPQKAPFRILEELAGVGVTD
ncbi:MAG TPA: Kdo hydroxylase family protein [Terriglobia bacterium]|nr:Kdo hydroxylase family protein [Terriglobia bacterium]